VKAGAIPGDIRSLRLAQSRHSLATFFAANDVNLPAIQSILRHAKPSTTALYTHCVNSAQMAAQAKFLDAIKVTAAAV
jgi:site-specific recombinase XerD